MTNADHIREMRDEDLAGVFAVFTVLVAMTSFKITSYFNDPYIKQITVKAAAEFLEWLQAPTDRDSFLEAFRA